MPPRKAAAAKPEQAPPSEASVDAAIKHAEELQTYPGVLHEMTVFQALRQVMVEIGPIAKDRRVSEGRGPKFNFRGIDDVLNAVHDSFAKWGVLVVPSGWEQIESSIGETKSGTTQLHVRGRHTFTVYGPNGDSITAVAPAEALDLSDKAASKSMSMAYKYVVIQMLSIPVAAGALDESDTTSVPYEAHAPQAPATPPPDAVWAKYDAAIADLGLSGREEASAKWREKQGMSFEEFQTAPIERVFAHVRQVVAYAKEQAKANDAPIEGAGNPPEDTNANADGDAAAGGQ